MPYVGYVEFRVPDVGKTADFYSKVFGWKPNEMFPGYLSIQSGDEPGIDTGISQAEEGAPTTVATLLVPDLDAAIADVEKHGGTITEPRFPIPGVGYGCYFTDPTGMTVGMWEADTRAA